MNIRDLLQVETPVSIVDIGASFSETPVYQTLLDNGWAHLVGFEPDAAELAKLAQRSSPHETYLPYFIGSGRMETFHETNWALTGSLYKPNAALLERFNYLAELMTLKATHKTPTRRLDDVAEISDIDLLKMDIQGAELKALQGGVRKLKNVQVVQLETAFVELYEGQPLFADVDAFLRRNGFQHHTFLGVARRSFKPVLINNERSRGLHQNLWADAVYVRDWMRPDLIPDDKLKKQAMILHLCYGSFDLAYAVLAQLDARTGGDLAARYLQLVASSAG